MVLAPSTAAPRTDRRVAARRQPTLGTVCRLTSSSGEDLGLGLVWNISASGVSMLLHRHLEPGTTVQAELRTDKDSFTLALPLQVAHVSRLQTGDYVIGGQFLRHLEPEEMRHYVA